VVTLYYLILTKIQF